MKIKDIIEQIQIQINDFSSEENPWSLLEHLQKHKITSTNKSYWDGVNILPNSNLITGSNCVIQPSTVINGNIILGNNVFIGAHCLIRGNVFIGDNTIIGSYNEISRSVIGNNNKISHRNDILDSVIGNNCWLTSNISIHNVKIDLSNIDIEYENEKSSVPTFGCIIEDNVKIGLWAKIMPGTVIPKNKKIIGPCIISKNTIRKLSTEKINL